MNLKELKPEEAFRILHRIGQFVVYLNHIDKTEFILSAVGYNEFCIREAENNGDYGWVTKIYSEFSEKDLE